MVISSRRIHATCHTSEVCCSKSTCACSRPLQNHASTGDTETLKVRSHSASVGSLCPGTHRVLFEPSRHLWQIWGLILSVISPLLQYCWHLSFALGVGYLFFGRIQHSPVDVCLAVSCSFGVLTRKDEHTSFYSAILIWIEKKILLLLYWLHQSLWLYGSQKPVDNF